MKKKVFSSLFLLSILFVPAFFDHPAAKAAPASDGKTLVLYDASTGSIPDETLMDFTDFPPGAASLTYSEGATVLDTTPSGSDTLAGWVSSQTTTTGFPLLDRTAGFQVNFTSQVESETHARNHRAGFSVIVLDRDAKGVELSFWENEIWAQNDDVTGGLFTHGEGVPFQTTALTDYQLAIVGDTYTLTANAVPILSGPVRDYSKFVGFPDPYETPNFLFLGDDTTSARVRMRLQYVSVTGTEPVLPTVAVTGTSTSIPLPTASFTPPPSFTPAPTLTPAPAGRVFPLCPSGWVLVMAAMSIAVLTKVNRR